MMQSAASKLLCAIVIVIHTVHQVHSRPNNFAIVHGKRSADLEPEIPQNERFKDIEPLKLISNYLDISGYDNEADSPYRREEPEVQTKVAHMFGRTLEDDQELSGVLLESLRQLDDRERLRDADRLLGDYMDQPYDDGPAFHRRNGEGVRLRTPRYPQLQTLQRKNNYPTHTGETNKNGLYRFISGFLRQNTLPNDDSNDVIGTF